MDSLPVSKLVVFTNGVAYFEHELTVTGNHELTLPVPAEHMNDVLQSLIVTDHGGGSVTTGSYASQDPLERVLAGYSLNVHGATSLRDLLTQTQGEHISLLTPTGEVTGTVLSTETRGGDHPAEYVTVLTNTGVSRIDLATVSDVTFTTEALQQELREVLATIAQYRGERANGITLAFTGEGERTVTIGYVREMPVWKTSYRLALTADNTATLQAWALLDNPTNFDLENVQVSLVAGNPISFITNLYEPRYVQRELVDVAVSEAIADLANQEAMPHPALYAPQAEMMARSVAASADMSSMQVDATGEAARTTFSFHVKNPVSVARHSSVMIPILEESLEATTVWHVAASNVNRVFESVHLENTGNLTLPAGPVTLYEGGVFNGTATLPLTAAGASDLVIAFGLASDVHVIENSASESNHTTRVTATDGVLVYEVVRTNTRTFTVAAPHTTREQPIYIDIAPRRGYTPVTKPTSELPSGELRYHVPVTSDGATFVYEEEQLVKREFVVANLSVDELLAISSTGELSPELQTALTRVANAKRTVSNIERNIARSEAEREAIYEEQERIRGNLGALSSELPLYNEYVQTLTEQEQTLSRINETLNGLRNERTEAENALTEAIRQLP